MWLGAGLSALGVLLTFTQTDAIREAVEDSDQTLTQSEIDTAVNFGIGMAVVSGLVAVGLWIWMSVVNGQGKSWARVVATVFGALNVVGTLFSLVGPGATALSLVLSVVGLVLAAVILVLLYRPDSSRVLRGPTAAAGEPPAARQAARLAPLRPARPGAASRAARRRRRRPAWRPARR